MKRNLFLLIVLAFSLWSCESDDRSPLLMRAISAEFFFDANQTSGNSISDTQFTFKGDSENRGTIQFFITGSELGDYTMADNTENYAIWTAGNGQVFDTRLGAGGGRVVIEKSAANRISGTFRFSAFAQNGAKKRFSRGEFNNVPTASSEEEETEE